MKTRITLLIYLLVTGNLTVSAQFSTAGTNSPFVAPEGFSFQVPADWKQIPRGALVGLLSDMRGTMPDMQSVETLYGFQPSAISTPVGYPRVLAYLMSSRNITDDDLKAVRKQMLMIQQKSNGKLESNTLGVATMVVEAAKLDENRHLLRVTMRGGLAESSDVQSTVAYFATSKGILFVIFLVKDSDYQNYSATFEGMLDSVRLENSLRPAQTTDVQSNDDWLQRIAEDIVKFIASFVGVLLIIFMTIRSIRRKWQ